MTGIETEAHNCHGNRLPPSEAARVAPTDAAARTVLASL